MQRTHRQELELMEEALYMDAYVADEYFIYYLPYIETLFLYYE